MRRVAANCLLIGLGLSAGCGDSAGPEAPSQMVYFDSQAQEAVVYDAAAELPATHPVTHRPTLMPALYCAQCEAWRPVPPPEQINRVPDAASCPKCRAALSVDGPWPDKHLK